MLQVVVVPIFMWGDIVKAVHYVQKRMLARNIEKVRLSLRSSWTCF